MEEKREEFKPFGAVAFFLAMVFIFLLMWLSVYVFELVGR
jgi:hypothetical protein